MKFVCLDCDAPMAFSERHEPGDGTFTAAFACPRCGRRVAMLANPMETQLVGALAVQIGGRTLDAPPMELTRTALDGRADAFRDVPDDAPVVGAERVERVRPIWSPEARDRLAHVPSFVRGMVKKLYGDFAAEHGIAEITPTVMDRARRELGLEEM